MADENSSMGVREELTSVLAQVEKLVIDNLVLEIKAESIRKKTMENTQEICRLLAKSRKLRGAMAVNTDDENVDVENLNEVRERNYVENQDHHEVLDTLERRSRGSLSWRKAKLNGIKEIEEQFAENSDAGASFHTDSQEPPSISVNTTEESGRFLLDESVMDCGKIAKKIPAKELAAISPTKLKLEENPPQSDFVCNFVSCQRTFTCASSIVSHLENHCGQDQARINCPFPGCKFYHTKEILTTHMRARHTREKLFSCQICPTKFHSMVAKVTHEKKHSQNDVWAQCVKQHCLKFYQVARGNCKSCGKK